ncbi:hypothetical protein D3C73_790200 [compost metagenome]
MFNNRFTACQPQPQSALLDLPRLIYREKFKEQGRKFLIRHTNSIILNLEIGIMLPQVSGHIHLQLILPSISYSIAEEIAEHPADHRFIDH